MRHNLRHELAAPRPLPAPMDPTATPEESPWLDTLAPLDDALKWGAIGATAFGAGAVLFAAFAWLSCAAGWGCVG